METRSGFVAIIGPANAGKSTLLNAILGEKISIVSRKQQSTRNRIVGIKTTDDAQLVFYDTPGFLKTGSKSEIARFLSEALTTSVAEADSVLLVVDAAHAVGNTSVVRQLRETLESRKLKQPSIIALNKIDLIDRRELLPMLEALQTEFGGRGDIHFVPISAAKGDGVDRLLQLMIDKLPEGPFYFPVESVTDHSEEFLVSEFIREALYDRVHQELPYSCAVRVIEWDEEPKRLKIGAQILVEKDSQKGIIIGKRGATLKAIGTAARIAIEKRFRTVVYLELFVRVEEEWTRSKRGMTRAGYSV